MVFYFLILAVVVYNLIFKPTDFQENIAFIYFVAGFIHLALSLSEISVHIMWIKQTNHNITKFERSDPELSKVLEKDLKILWSGFALDIIARSLNIFGDFLCFLLSVLLFDTTDNATYTILAFLIFVINTMFIMPAFSLYASNLEYFKQRHENRKRFDKQQTPS